MHARVLSLILTLLVSSFLIPVSAQIYQPEGLNIPGEWNGWTNPPAAGAFLSSSQAGGLVNLITMGERRWTTTFQSDYTGSRQFLFTSGPSGNPYNNKWGGVTTTLNTIQNYFYQSGTNNSVNVTNGKYYTINWDDNGYVNTNAIVMETSNAPVTISSDSQNPVSSAVYNYNSVIVTANLSASLSPEEKVYLRYSTDNWVNITNVLMTVSGSTAQAVIPPFATGTNVSYSIVTTTRTFASNEGNYNADLSTIRRNENNRSYTVLAPVGGCVAVGNPSDWGINQWNVYVYNASSANAWVNNYVGYYSMPDLSFNTDLNQTNSNFYSWDKNGSPANAPGYQGCTAENDNHSFRMKRQGFPCGAYQISVTDIDDLGELYVNGTLVWKNHVCCGLSSAVWGGYLDANSTVEFKVLELSGGSVCGLTFASLPEPTAVITPTNPTEINCNGVITLSNVSGGACHLVSAPFNGVIPSGSSFYGSGQIPSGDPNYCMLTPNNGSQLGTWAYTPTYRPTAFSVRYRQYMGQGSEADGMSFNYGNFNPAVGGGESGFGKLVIAFKTYGADVVQLLYDGVLIASYSPSFGLSNEAWTPTQIDISADGKVTLIFNGTTVFNQVQLPAGYATADKSNWIYAFSGRTGAATDLHAIDDLTIYSRDNLEFFVSGVTSSWTTSKTINAPAGTYTVQARNVCGTGCTYTLGSVTINDPSSPSLTVTSTNGTGQSYNDGVADCGMSSSTFGWLTDGSYSVTVNGCTNANYTVTEEFVVNGTVQNTETWNLSGTATWTPNRFWSVGVTTVNVTVTDSEGNAFTTTYTVTITDNEPLSIVAPADITACSGTTVDLGSATVGGCWTNVSNDAPANLPLGNTTITWTITGASGNTATDTQVVTIIETVTPSVTISASPDLQVCPAPSPGGNDENMIFFTASTTNCGDNPTFQWYVNGDNWGYNSPNVSGNVFIGGEQIYVTVIPTNDCQTSNLVTSNILVPVAMNAQSYYVDYDGDGYGNSFNSQMACSPQPGLTTVGGDCDDYNANAYPGATEICGNGADDDCQNGDIQCTGCTNSTACNYSASATIDDGSCVYPQTYYYDGDGDGYGINELPALANSTYFVQSIPYTTFPWSTTECVPDNSQYDWANLPIGFSFPFYNQTYNSFNVTDKGYVSFGSWLPWWQSSGSPSPVPSGTEDLIAFGWSDWGGAGCNARVQYYSNPAKAVVYHSAYYHLSNYSGGSAGAQDNFMALYPNGVIEMYVNNSYQTPNYIPNNNPAQSPASQRYVMGVQGGDGSAGTGISPYNYAVGHNISQQAWRLYMPVVSACSQPSGYVLNNTDCDDSNASVNAGGTEICGNGIDDDCIGGDLACNVPGCTDNTACNYNSAATNDDGSCSYGSSFYADTDNDGYGAGTATQACTQPTGFVTNNTDCNDSNSAVYPGATETCNTVDDDCDGTTDEGVQSTFYADADGDGFGELATSTDACTAPTGYVSNSTDCDDSDNAVYPGATETCNDIDDDCDGTADDGLPTTTYYVDGDGDGFGTTTSADFCEDPGVGYATNNTDCNDTNAQINTTATELCNGVDDNCNNQTDEGLPFTDYYVDSDGDGYGAGTAASFCANPGASYATTNTDCNNGNANIYPGATETCNGVDDDCDGSTDEGVLNTYYADADGDGYGNSGNTQTACSQPTGYVTVGGDCFDGSAAINPGATEICNNIDDNCDGTIDNAFVNYYADSDGDGFGGGNAVSIQSCTTPAGYTTSATDCNNANANVYPGAIEICNGIDDDCDSNIDEGVLMTYYLDSDGDGFGGTTSTTGCSAPNGYVSSSTDCNDTNSAVNPGATEVCNSIDDDCDGTTDEGCPSTTPGEEPSNAVSAPSSYYSYCSNFYGTLAGALPSTYAQSTCVTGEDKWYTFTALSSGVTIFIGSYFNDILIELQDVNGNLIETENAVNGIGTEVMNYVGLTAGQVYRVGVRNYNSNLAAGNQFSGCIRHLKRGGCDSGTVGGGNWPSQISMCSVFKATYAGSGVQYRYTWTGLTGGATGNVYTRTQSSDYLSLTNVTPTLQSGCQYSVLVTNLYTIANGAGVNEVLEVPALAPCTITILADATVQLRSTDQCSNGPRFRSSVVASLPWVCGVNNWRWRFTEVNPSTYQVIGLPIEINRGAASNYLNLGTVAALQYGKTYAVQTAPVFTYTGSNYQWGPVQYLCIIGQSGMSLNNDSNNQAEDNRSDFGIAQDFDMALYPNPTNGDELNITLSGVSGDDQALVRIMNTFGQIVYEGKWNSEGVIQKQINVSRWSNGMYLFEVRSGEQTLNKRFMISQ